jgi:hypothetical protein
VIKRDDKKQRFNKKNKLKPLVKLLNSRLGMVQMDDTERKMRINQTDGCWENK